MAGFKNGSGVRVTRGTDTAELMERLKQLADTDVLVGFPESTAERNGDGKSAEINNAALGYIHDQGAPEANIPPRPFMEPGIQEAQEEISAKLGQVLKAVITKGAGADVVDQGLSQVGIIASLAIQNAINEGPPPPLADSTLRARARRGKGKDRGALRELDRRWDGQEPSVEFAKPLVVTGEMRNAVTYAIRPKSKRRN